MNLTTVTVLGKREQNKAQNRSTILEAALDVFIELGYDAATVRDIIRRTNLAAGTFYNYFPDKESVFLELLNEKLAAINDEVRGALRHATDTESFFSETYRAMFAYMANDRASLELLRRNAGTIRALLDASIFGANVEDSLSDIKQAIAQGILPEIDADYLASAMAGISFEMCVRMVERQPIDVEEATRFATAMLTGGVERLSRS